MAADWLGLALIHSVLGYEANVLGILVSDGVVKATEGLLITAFLLYTISVVLIVLAKVAGLGQNAIITICTLVMLAIAGILIVIGVGVWGGDNATGNSLSTYNGTLDISSAAMAFLAAVFLLLNLLGGGGSQTSPNA